MSFTYLNTKLKELLDRFNLSKSLVERAKALVEKLSTEYSDSNLDAKIAYFHDRVDNLESEIDIYGTSTDTLEAIYNKRDDFVSHIDFIMNNMVVLFGELYVFLSDIETKRLNMNTTFDTLTSDPILNHNNMIKGVDASLNYSTTSSIEDVNKYITNRSADSIEIPMSATEIVFNLDLRHIRGRGGFNGSLGNIEVLIIPPMAGVGLYSISVDTGKYRSILDGIHGDGVEFFYTKTQDELKLFVRTKEASKFTVRLHDSVFVNAIVDGSMRNLLTYNILSYTGRNRFYKDNVKVDNVIADNILSYADVDPVNGVRKNVLGIDSLNGKLVEYTTNDVIINGQSLRDSVSEKVKHELSHIRLYQSRNKCVVKSINSTRELISYKNNENLIFVVDVQDMGDITYEPYGGVKCGSLLLYNDILYRVDDDSISTASGTNVLTLPSQDNVLINTFEEDGRFFILTNKNLIILDGGVISGGTVVPIETEITHHSHSYEEERSEVVNSNGLVLNMTITDNDIVLTGLEDINKLIPSVELMCFDSYYGDGKLCIFEEVEDHDYNIYEFHIDIDDITYVNGIKYYLTNNSVKVAL